MSNTMVRYMNKKQRATALMMVVDRQPATDRGCRWGPSNNRAALTRLAQHIGVTIAKPLTPSNPTKLAPYIMEG